MAAPAVPTLEATVHVTGSEAYVRLLADFDAATDELDIYRVGPSGVPGYVRGVQAFAAGGLTVYDVVDYEAPFGIPLAYTAVARNSDGATSSAAVEVEVDVDDDWLVDLDDARNSGAVLIESLTELSYDVPQGVHRVLGRRTPIVTSDLRFTPSGTLVLVTETVDEARRVRDALGSSSPLLLRSRFERGVGNMYLQAGAIAEQRISPLAVEPARRWQVPFTEIDRPDPSLYLPKAVTWAEVVATWDSWTDLLADRATWADLLVDRTGLPDTAAYSLEPAFPTRDV